MSELIDCFKQECDQEQLQWSFRAKIWSASINIIGTITGIAADLVLKFQTNGDLENSR